MEWVSQMRLRWWSQGNELDKKLTEAYDKESKLLQQALEEISITSGWSTVGVDEDLQTSDLSPGGGPSPTPEKEAESPQ